MANETMMDFQDRDIRRSRTGCLTCKKRKVKCDEGRPTCNNCQRFCVPCVFEHTTPGRTVQTAQNSNATEASSKSGRRRGRPRKDWDLEMTDVMESTPRIKTTDAAVQCTIDTKTSCLDISDVELLLHFTAHTSHSLVAPGDLNHHISRFYALNVPRIGLSFPFVMQLVLSLAARHLAHFEGGSPERRRHYVSLAYRHLSVGVAEATRLLPNIDATNCGALYTSSMLVCYSSFAAGPSGPRDLLICHASGSSSQMHAPEPWMPLIRGTRLISETFPRDVLHSGLMAPLGTENKDEPTFRPSFIQENFERINWTAPLDEIRRLVLACDDEIAPARLHSFNLLAAIYEATYGKDETGSCDVVPAYRFLFIWLYQIEDDFITGLRRGDAVCLLMLAYWALLLRTYAKYWFMDGWSKHLLAAVRDIIDPDFARWMKWPLEIAGSEMRNPCHWDVTNR